MAQLKKIKHNIHHHYIIFKNMYELRHVKTVSLDTRIIYKGHFDIGLADLCTPLGVHNWEQKSGGWHLG